MMLNDLLPIVFGKLKRHSENHGNFIGVSLTCFHLGHDCDYHRLYTFVRKPDGGDDAATLRFRFRKGEPVVDVSMISSIASVGMFIRQSTEKQFKWLIKILGEPR